ncbi:MAG: O-antigen ligase family protein [Ardenticatenaceae bacterium]|nr:O-antigen ligase family protein [Ardenticatenaceae bacterium]MCB9442667.1 O-antigen ligase family protein [Ardenticatenaceae bacterium]
MFYQLGRLNELSVNGRQTRAKLHNLTWQIGLLGLILLSGLLLFKTGPGFSVVAWMLYFVGVLAIFYEPRYGLYLLVFLTLVGDSGVMPWFPFVKNFSSRESLLYLHDSIIISPLDTYLIFTLISWLGRGMVQRKYSFFAGSLFWPAIAFLTFVVIGLLYGLGTGGSVNIALWESRPLFYLILMLILTSNLLEKREHYSWLIWSAMLSIAIEAIHGLYIFITEANFDFSKFDQSFDHTASIHFNTFIVFVVAAWVFRASISKRITLTALLPFVGLTYMAMQRRAAFLTLAIALILVSIFLLKESRIAFSLIVPPLAAFALVYIIVFWNSSGALGLPARAIKSVVAEDQADASDQSSNLYRVLENANISFTIHTSPIFGVGFGQKFYVVYPMPDISFFEWWEYFPHNSIMWIWLKMGFGGFGAMIFLVGYAIMTGVRAAWRMPGRDLSAIALTATLYVLMHFTFAYADISWDAQSMLYVGTMMGIIGSIEHVTSKPVPLPPKRWHWQKEPEPAPDLRPIPSKN